MDTNTRIADALRDMRASPPAFKRNDRVFALRDAAEEVDAFVDGVRREDSTIVYVLRLVTHPNLVFTAPERSVRANDGLWIRECDDRTGCFFFRHALTSVAQWDTPEFRRVEFYLSRVRQDPDQGLADAVRNSARLYEALNDSGPERISRSLHTLGYSPSALDYFSQSASFEGVDGLYVPGDRASLLRSALSSASSSMRSEDVLALLRHVTGDPLFELNDLYKPANDPPSRRPPEPPSVKGRTEIPARTEMLTAAQENDLVAKAKALIDDDDAIPSPTVNETSRLSDDAYAVLHRAKSLLEAAAHFDDDDSDDDDDDDVYRITYPEDDDVLKRAKALLAASNDDENENERETADGSAETVRLDGDVENEDVLTQARRLLAQLPQEVVPSRSSDLERLSMELDALNDDIGRSSLGRRREMGSAEDEDRSQVKSVGFTEEIKRSEPPRRPSSTNARPFRRVDDLPPKRGESASCGPSCVVS